MGFMAFFQQLKLFKKIHECNFLKTTNFYIYCPHIIVAEFVLLFITHQHLAMPCVMKNKHDWTEEHKEEKASHDKLQAFTFPGSVRSLLITYWLNTYHTL